MSAKRLSKGEKKVVDGWNGSVKETAKKCGLSYGYVRNLMTLPYIIKLIQTREDRERNRKNAPKIADREERQAFWSSVARGEPHVVEIKPKMDGDEPVLDDGGKPVMVKIFAVPTMKDRLRAAELLGRSNADFVDRLHISDLDKGVPKEITDNMDQKEATNTYMDMIKPGNA